MAQTAEEVLVSMNVDPGMFQLLAVVAESCSWLAQGEEWTSKKAVDVAVAITDFFGTVENVTTSAPELAEHFGTTTERAEYIFGFFSNAVGIPFPDAVGMVAQILPAIPRLENNSDLFIGIFVMLTVLAFGFVGLRLYSRWVVNGFIRAHDYIIVAAALIAIVFGAVNSACLSGPTHLRGRWLRSWDEYHVDVWSGKTTEVLYPTGIFLVKASLLLFYWGLTTWWPLRASVIFVGIISFGNSLAMILTAVLRCKPFVAYEGYEYFTAVCDMNLYAKGEEVCGAINIATDIVIWLMPLPMVWKITQGLRERLLASVTFGLGALACIACGMRFSQSSEYRTPSLIPRDQSRWLIWALVEMFMAIICSCVPAIRALIIKRAPSLIGSVGVETSDYDKDEKSTDKSTDKEKTMINVDSDSV